MLYEESIRLVTRQAAVLGELRTRASIVLTATSIVASLLGADALTRTDTFPLALLPAGALVAGLLCCLAVFRPVHDKPKDLGPRLTGAARVRALLWHKDTDPREWQVTVGARTLKTLRTRPNAGVVRMEIVELLQKAAPINHQTISFRNHFLGAACLLLLAQLFLWGLVLLRHPSPVGG